MCTLHAQLVLKKMLQYLMFVTVTSMGQSKESEFHSLTVIHKIVPRPIISLVTL